MEQNNRYYQPTMEEMYVGYKFEYTFGGDDIWTESEIKTTTNLYYLDDIRTGRIGREGGGVRTRYLDKQDIEKCGWEHTGGQLISSGRQDYEIIKNPENVVNSRYILSVYPDNINIQVKRSYNTETLNIYNGKCPSINELRKIMEWVGITNG